MREDIFYLPESYADDLFAQYNIGERVHIISDLKEKIRFLKFYSNNDFAFKDVHNEELFYQNGKVLVEMVQLFQYFRIIGTHNLQFLGDLFEQLLNKGFKQSEGQFFTPYPITRFMWKSLPLRRYVGELPRVLDYACGAGHFLTEGYEEIINENRKSGFTLKDGWERTCIFGIEKDYRLARVSKISMFMHGANEANIIFGDGLDNHKTDQVFPKSFDIIVANPPYSVASFKQHLILSENVLDVINFISKDGGEIETCFVERINQLLKPKGIAAVILPSSLLEKNTNSFIKAREIILDNFKIKAIVNLRERTFGETGTTTIVLFLEKYNEPPTRLNQVMDSVESIVEKRSNLGDFEDEEIMSAYLRQIQVSKDDYLKFLNKETLSTWKGHRYFGDYYDEFIGEIKNYDIGYVFSEEDTNKFYMKKYWPLEKEKMKYFGLTYNQKTIVVDAPSKTKEQKLFLGYTWSKRKGQEGIKVSSPNPGNSCGSLYKSEEMAIADVIRNSFYNEYANLVEYSRCVKTCDFLKFKGVKFTKSINTAARKINLRSGYSLYRFDDSLSFNLSIGKRVTKEECSENGTIPVCSANVEDEFGKADSNVLDPRNIRHSSDKLVLWSIDNDWIVNITEPDYCFYPTDHCGVIEIKNKQLSPDYVRYALLEAGRYEGFSRAKRANLEKIKELEFQAPNLTMQKQIVDEILPVEQEILAISNNLRKIDNDIVGEFIRYSSSSNSFFELDKIAEMEKGGTLTRDEAIIGNVPVVAGGQTPSCYHNTANRSGDIITVSSSGEYSGFINYWDCPIFATDCTTIKSKDSRFKNIYIYYAMKSKQEDFYSFQKGSGQPHVYMDDFKHFKIPFIESTRQSEFVKYANALRKQVSKLEKDIVEKMQTKEALISKYFD